MLLAVDQLEKSFGSGAERQSVLRKVSLTLEAGQSLAITGESGSGKSTLLHLIGLLDTVDGGEIRLQDEIVTTLGDSGRAARRRSKIGLIFQQFNLVPSLSVAGNLSLQARLAKTHDPEWADTLAERLGLQSFLHRYPEQLSGGQQQRVAVGRALAGKPALLLADEPTGNLDEATSADVLDLMLELCADAGAGLIMATHSMRAADRLSRREHLEHGQLT